MKHHIFLFFTLLICNVLLAQHEFQFAQVSDVHIGSHNADEDLRRTVQDINANSKLKFIIISGDITEFGSDKELQLAKQILDSLQKPWYIVPGNHDNNWSESGTNSFVRIFGTETFFFEYGGFYFMGTNCGPNMKMSPGQVPYENIVWLDSLLRTIPPAAPIVFVNHYPLDSSLNNWYDITDPIKKHNVQLYMCGHGHHNRQLDFEDIPGVMGRSNLRAKDTVGGYNIITVSGGQATYEERTPGVATKKPWTKVHLVNHHFKKQRKKYYRPDYSLNQKFPQVRETGRYQDSSDIGNGFVLYKNYIITPDARGRILAIDQQQHKVVWQFTTLGKIYAAPALSKDRLVVPSTDGTIYCLDPQNGNLLWKLTTGRSITASPVTDENTIYLGSSESVFRAIDLQTGKIKWTFDSVKNFVKTIPLIDDDKIFFGSWGNEFYCLDKHTGKPLWIYRSGGGNRMLSAASCTPVAANGRVFIVAPDRYMTALDVHSGRVIWRHRWDEHRVRESIGISTDKKMVYAKTMDGYLIGVDVAADTASVVWKTDAVFGYELNPSRIMEHDNVVYAWSDKGVIGAFDRKTGKTKWLHKIANCLVHDVQCWGKNRLVATTMDGKVVWLQVDE